MPRTFDPFDQFIYAEAYEGQTDSGNKFIKIVFTDEVAFKPGDTIYLNKNRAPKFIAMHRLPQDEYERLKEQKKELQR